MSTFWGIAFYDTKYKNVKKTVLNSFTSVKIFYTPLGHITQNTSAKNFYNITPELTEIACKSWRHICQLWNRKMTLYGKWLSELKDNQANINNLSYLRCHGHFLSSCMLLKFKIDGESMQELTTYLANY